LSFEWALIDEVNDTPQQSVELVKLIKENVMPR
jgi:adenine C2-methylase RlmN of 23S rRNA A2503 and tRNA A37